MKLHRRHIYIIAAGLLMASACAHHHAATPRVIPISKALRGHTQQSDVYGNMMYAEYITEFGDLAGAEKHFEQAAKESNDVDPWLSLADIQMKRCETAAAGASLKKAMSIDMTAWYGWLLQSGVETRNHNWQAVADALQTAASLSPEDPYVWYLLAEQEFMLHGPEAAAEVVVGALEANPDNESLVRFLLRLGIITNNRLLVQTGLETLRMLSVDSYTTLINTLVEEGRQTPPEDLKDIFQSQLYGANPLPGEQLAWAGLLLRWGDTTQALAVLEKLHAYDPGDTFLSYVIMQVLTHYADVATVVNWEQTHHSDSAWVYNTLLVAEYLYDKGLYSRTLAMLDALPPQRPDIDRDIARQKARALLKLNMPDKARQVILSAAGDGSDLRGKLLWIWYLSRTGQSRELKQQVQPMLRAEPENFELLFEALGYAYDLEDAPWVMTAIQDLAQRFPTQGAMLNFYGFSLAERGENLDEALCLLSEAYTQNHTAAVRDSLAWALFQQGQCAMAERMLYLAVERWPDETEILWHFAQVRIAMGLPIDDIMKDVTPATAEDMSRVSRQTLEAYRTAPGDFRATLPVCQGN